MLTFDVYTCRYQFIHHLKKKYRTSTREIPIYFGKVIVLVCQISSQSKFNFTVTINSGDVSLPCSQNSNYRKVVFHWHIQPYGLKFKCNIFSPLIFLAVEQFLCFTLILLVCKISCLSSLFCHHVPMVDCILPEGMAHVFSNLYGFQCIDTSNDIDYFCYKSIQYTSSISHWQQ